jgi:hypothetical protein
MEQLSIFRRLNRNFSRINGLFGKVVLSYRLERFNGKLCSIYIFFSFLPVPGSSRFNSDRMGFPFEW